MDLLCSDLAILVLDRLPIPDKCRLMSTCSWFNKCPLLRILMAGAKQSFKRMKSRHAHYVHVVASGKRRPSKRQRASKKKALVPLAAAG
jgi:hypothetical protein